MGGAKRAFLLFVTVLVLLVPTVQLTSIASPPAAHQLSGKTLGKTSTASRVPAVVAARPAVVRDAMAVRVTTIEDQHARPGFSTAPFVPPRG